MLNPRYACFCVAKGYKTVAEADAAELIQWPGGKMVGYILWNKERISEFAQSLSDHDAERCFLHGNLREEGHRRYDAWLQKQHPGWDAVSLKGEDAA